MRKIQDQVYYDIEALHKYNVDLQTRSLYLFGEEDSNENPDGGEPGVEYIMANRFIKNLHFLAGDEKRLDEPILVHMKTNGGYWEEGMAIYDAIKTCPAPVYILNYTHARSMSSIIFQAAKYRVMMPNSYFMFHHGSMSTSGEYTTVISEIDFYKKMTPVMLNIYSDAMIASEVPKWEKHTKKSIIGWLNRQMEKKVDVFLTAEETIENGLADEVFDGDWERLRSAE